MLIYLLSHSAFSLHCMCDTCPFGIGVPVTHRIGVNQTVRNRLFDCHLSPNWRQMAIKNTDSSDFDPRSSIVKNVFDCGLSGESNKRQQLGITTKQ